MLKLVRDITDKGSVTSRRNALIGGRYEVQQVIAERASGSAVRALDLTTQEPVFLKMFSPDFLAHYRREAAAAMQMQHPNLLRAIDTASGGAEDMSWIAYPFISGTSVRESTNQRPGDISYVWQCAADVLKALVYMHQQGWIHCDVKPDNLIYMQSTEVERFVLVDLGAATTIKEARDGKHVVGSPAYTAPERLYDAFGPQSDLYSVGVLCFELATGHLPFIGTVKEIYRGHLSGGPAFQEIADQDLRLLVESLMEKQPARRMRSAHDALAAVLASVNNASIERSSPYPSVSMPVVAREKSSLARGEHLQVVSSFALARAPVAVMISGAPTTLGVIYENHAEFLNTQGQPLGPSVISAGPFARGVRDGFVGCVGGRITHVDPSRKASTTRAKATGVVRAVCEGDAAVAWSDGRDVTVAQLSGASSSFRNRTYAGDVHMTFAGEKLIACSGGFANHEIGLFEVQTGRFVRTLASLSGPVVCMTFSDSTLLCASLLPEHAGACEISSISIDGHVNKTVIGVAKAALAGAADAIFWVDEAGLINVIDTRLVIRKLGPSPSGTRLIAVSPIQLDVVVVEENNGVHTVHVMEIQ